MHCTAGSFLKKLITNNAARVLRVSGTVRAVCAVPMQNRKLNPAACRSERWDILLSQGKNHKVVVSGVLGFGDASPLLETATKWFRG